MLVQNLKGFRDFLPTEAKKRQYVIAKIREVFESYGFEPLETPALEYKEILTGKYGEEEKLIYDFKTRGGDEVALRYDQTVPLARVVAQYQDKLPMPFKRYQIQNVWRGENTQKGRYREFIQCDADIVGTTSLLADAEIIKLVLDIYESLGLKVRIKINDRKNFENLDKNIVAAIDKLEKIGESSVLSEMTEKGMEEDEARRVLSELSNKPQTETIKFIIQALGENADKVSYEPTLARGLDYYTGVIFETVIDEDSSSLCSGGRYDNLIGMFSKQIPAIGFGLGFDRTIEILEEKGLLPDLSSSSKALVTDNNEKALKIAEKLRTNGINTEIWLSEETDLGKKIKYAEKKGIPYIIKFNGDEVILGNMKTNEQKIINLEEIIELLRKPQGSI